MIRRPPGRCFRRDPEEDRTWVIALLTALQPLLGLAAVVAFAWGISENRRRFPLRGTAAGLTVQLALALLLLKLPGSQIAFFWVGAGLQALQQATEAGTTLVFGFLGGGPLPFAESHPDASFVFAFRILPLVLLTSALSAVLYHYRILPWAVRGFAYLLGRALGIGGAASFATAANVFIGMVEAPLLVRPYLAQMSRAELFIVMTGGMATIAGTVLVLYTTLLRDLIPNAAGHLLTASVISAPAAVSVARIMVPGERDGPAGEPPPAGQIYENGVDALTRGVIDGLRLLAYIVGMLIVLVALVELANILLRLGPDVLGSPLTLQRVLGWILAPAVWLLGVPWPEATTAGRLLGDKVVLNELVAYLRMAELPAGSLGERSSLIMTYTLCGFANFGGLGIMLGGIGALVPERRLEIAQLGLKSVLAGNLATAMTGAVAALLHW